MSNVLAFGAAVVAKQEVVGHSGLCSLKTVSESSEKPFVFVKTTQRNGKNLNLPDIQIVQSVSFVISSATRPKKKIA